MKGFTKKILGVIGFFAVGPILLSLYITWASYLERNYLLYSNCGEIRKDLDMFEDTDANLVWMMRSREYAEATKDEKCSMRRTWAKQRIDMSIGRFFRIIIIGLPFVISLMSIAMLLSSIAGCD